VVIEAVTNDWPRWATAFSARAVRAVVAIWLGVQPVGIRAADVSAPIREGEAKLAAGDLDAGLALFREAVQADPGSALAHTRLGGALLLNQQYSEAIAEFRVGIGLDPKNADAFVGMAVAYLHGGDYALARAALDEAKRLDPSKQSKIDALIGYIDRRDSVAASPGAH
jgi:tetratricopeptide (TPR) repeat protein